MQRLHSCLSISWQKEKDSSGSDIWGCLNNRIGPPLCLCQANCCVETRHWDNLELLAAQKADKETLLAANRRVSTQPQMLPPEPSSSFCQLIDKQR